MEQGRHTTNDWAMSNVLWFAVLVWFSSSLLSQAAYMAVHGLPYDSITLLKTLGPFYYIFIAVEVGFWLAIAVTVAVRSLRKFEILPTKETQVQVADCPTC